MKVLIYLAGTGLGASDGQHLDMAISELKKGNEVFIINCDETIGLCTNNPGNNPLVCQICKHFRKKNLRKMAPKGCEIHQMKEYTDEIDKAKLPKFDYSSCEELKNITYKGIDIGYGVMSSYISLTRNLYPAINSESKVYFDALIEEQLVSLKVLEKLNEENHFGLVIFQNGRGAQFRPFLNFCQREKINFWCTEDWGYNRKHNFTNNYWNTTPHDLDARSNQFLDCWESSKENDEQKVFIGKRFFENRRNAKPAGDKVYVKDQIEGTLPNDWNPNKDNIVIFNSSEDEFAAISHAVDKEKVFLNQLEGIRTIVEHYKDDTSKHFTLRIHPNLKDVPYKYHTDLYKLNYPNLTVIPGSSSVSTYTLMDEADKVVVFGSTAGIEAAYWNKPVICLGPSMYKGLGVVYLPKQIEEIWKLLETKNLPSLKNDNVLKYGYFWLSDNHERTEHISIDVVKIKVGKHNPLCFEYQKLFGSNYLYIWFMGLVDKVLALRFPAQFRKLPNKEA